MRESRLKDSITELTRRSNIEQDNTTCGADSFMLRDGVCDETANNAKCLFDGGDCCKENKDKGLCRNCTCILSIDQENFDSQLNALNVRPIKDPEQLNTKIETRGWTVVVEDVTSVQVCSVVCLEHKKMDELNAWLYEINERICKCGWIESSLCPEEMAINDWTWEGQTMENKAFVVQNKTVSCGTVLTLL